MVSLEDRVHAHPQVVDTEFDEGDTVLLHLESKQYYSLNTTGTQIWRGLKAGLTLQEISHQLQARFDVDAERADRSVLALLEDLFQHQLVQRR
jgi:hypothetical protein